MSSQKTETPTPRRQRKAREEGNVARSQNVNSAVVLLAAIGAALFLATAIGSATLEATRGTLASVAALPTSAWGLVDILNDALRTAATPVLALLVVVAVPATFASFVQVGPLLTLKTLAPKLERLNPGKGIQKRVFSLRALVELIKGVFALIVVAAVLYAIVQPRLAEIALLPRAGVEGTAEFAAELVFLAVVGATAAFAFLAAADFGYQKWQHGKDLMMSPDEVQREYKDSEGDPQAKAARQRLHEEILQNTMVEQARKADVIIVNPEHIACALKYDPDENVPPQLIARGRNHLAQRIKEVAKEEGIPIARDVPLARLLHGLEVDEYIPEDLYEAVGVVLRWVAQEARARGEITPWDHLV